jgi:NAD(P)-dependent dehydrogenase (short-subunit alcohol dehydrogenase family)
VTVRFDGQVALVTGAGKGMGRAYALWMAERGAKVVVNNRVRPGQPSSASEVVDEIRALGGEAVVDTHPVEDETSGTKMVQTALDAFGRIDIVVSNAGIMEFDDFRDLDLEAFRRTMDINFWGSVYPVMAAVPLLLEQGYGRIVMTTSSAGVYGQSKSAAYSASRAAVVGFARSIAADTRDTSGFGINLVLPSAYTQASSSFHNPAHAEFMSPARAAAVVGWLCSSDCTRSGLILHAGYGRVRRIQVFEGKVIDIPDEDLRLCWPDLDDMEGASEPVNSGITGREMRSEIYAT